MPVQQMQDNMSNNMQMAAQQQDFKMAMMQQQQQAQQQQRANLNNPQQANQVRFFYTARRSIVNKIVIFRFKASQCTTYDASSYAE